MHLPFLSLLLAATTVWAAPQPVEESAEDADLGPCFPHCHHGPPPPPACFLPLLCPPPPPPCPACGPCGLPDCGPPLPPPPCGGPHCGGPPPFPCQYWPFAPFCH
ncbi:hypothetical protein M409DRAFT_29241 [Zasmidium cellare ATCC 36951]|uniref:IGFBP N-terminal domain-containing protein n=1 Tax=Zasmidium cellare ATCC 36951 TaxID=1080233 RepID=A0A6A6C0A3_ZASCE|nr:uncharacterized protein M409DRAFT_29241 [Zasmidium cellare ATCC 36951]KAF2160395.1 hypothetical protein M409DRAFT_29241 [Zasmidium cellare ATCC 36951]